MKFLFSLKCPSPQGGSAFVLVTEEQIYGQIRVGHTGICCFAIKSTVYMYCKNFIVFTNRQFQLHVFRLDLAGDGLSVANCRPLLSTPLSIGGEYICSMREDAPEIVVMANPGLRVRIRNVYGLDIDCAQVILCLRLLSKVFRFGESMPWLMHLRNRPRVSQYKEQTSLISMMDSSAMGQCFCARVELRL